VSAAIAAVVPVHFERLDNGLSLLVDCDRSSPIVAVQAWAQVGSADESRRSSGVAHMVEHMMFKGTARRGVGDIAREIEGAGGEINAWTSFDETVFHAVVARTDFVDAVDVLGDALGHSVFDEDELEREREVLFEELRQHAGDPGRNLAQELFSTAFARHPYGRPVIGFEDSIARLGRSELRRFVDRFYTADNTALVISGDIDVATARAEALRRFDGYRRGAVRRSRTREPRQTSPRSSVIVQETSDALLAVGFPAPPMGSPDTPLLDLAGIALGQGPSSRLETSLVRDRSLARGAFGYLHSLRDAGMFVVTASLDPDQVVEAARVVLAELAELAERALGSAELAKARRVVEADEVFLRETAQGRARALGSHFTLAGDAAARAHYLERVRNATTEQVRRAVAEHIRPERANLVAVLPTGVSEARPRSRAALERRLAAAPQVAGRAPVAKGRASKAAAPSSDASGVVRDQLPSGLRVLVKPDSSIPLVAVRILWPGGSRLETESTNGVNHLLSRLITSGCGDLDGPELAQQVDALAGSLGGFSGRSSFGVRGEWLASDWQRALEIMTDCVLEPRWDDVEFHRERRLAMDAARARAVTASQVAFRELLGGLFPGHPYRLDTRGTEASIAGLSRDRLVRFFEAYYPPGAAVISVVGDVDPGEVTRFVRARFESASRRAPRQRKIKPPRAAARTAGPAHVYSYLDREQSYLAVGFPGASLHDPDRFAVEVLTTVLSGQSGRLFARLRDELSLAYRLGAFSVEGIDPGFIAVYLSCTADKASDAYAALEHELRRIIDEGVTAEEVERAKRYLIGTHEISLQRRGSIAAALGFHEAYGLGYHRYMSYAPSIGAVTAADVGRVARKYLDWDAAVVSTVVPPDLTPEAARRARGTRRKPRRGRGGR